MMLVDLLERQANDRPHAAALLLRDQTLTWTQLQEQVLHCAAALSAKGVKSGDRFGLVSRNSIEFVVVFFALARLGAIAVPVNFLLKADEIAFIFEDAGVVGVLTQKAFLGCVEDVKRRVPSIRDIFVDLPLAEGNLPPAPTDPELLAMIIYTSGTTGKPKGAMLTHRNFLANVEQCWKAVPSLSAREVFLCLLPMFHSFSWTVCVLLPLYLGARIVIVESIQPFGNVIRQIFKRRVSIFVAVPPIFAAMHRIPFWYPMRWINPVRMCISGAAALPNAVQRAFESKFGVPLMEGYGLTEASPVVTLNPQGRRVPGSVGRPLPGIELRIVDESGRACEIEEAGEICVRGDNTMKGYYQQEDATRESFLDPDHRWLKTGDIGFLDAEGYLHISDRKKDLIIVKGLNVYPKEVEDVLLSHPAVAEAAVIGRRDETGDELIFGYVTLKPDLSVDRQELMKLCRAKLATYKCPKDIEIRQELPKNTLGKILKRELRKA